MQHPNGRATKKKKAEKQVSARYEKIAGIRSIGFCTRFQRSGGSNSKDSGHHRKRVDSQTGSINTKLGGHGRRQRCQERSIGWLTRETRRRGRTVLGAVIRNWVRQLCGLCFPRLSLTNPLVASGFSVHIQCSALLLPLLFVCLGNMIRPRSRL